MVKGLSLFTIEDVLKANEKFMGMDKEERQLLKQVYPISENEINSAFAKATEKIKPIISANFLSLYPYP